MIKDRVISVISKELDLDENNIKLNDTFEKLGIDSLEVFEIIMSLEEEFDIQISNEDTEKLCTVEEILKYIEGRIV